MHRTRGFRRGLLQQKGPVLSALLPSERRSELVTINRAIGPRTRSTEHRALILVTAYPGQPSCADLEREAAAGERPRKDYVELARLLGADVVDDSYLARKSTRLARLVGRVGGRPAAQVVEAFLRGGEYDHVFAWPERIGLPLALIHKLARVDRDVVVVAAWPSRGGKAFMLKTLRVHTHLRAIMSGSSAQLEIAAARLRVPRQKLHLLPQPVDELFWRPYPQARTNLICSVGATGRDYETLFRAVRELDLELRIAVGRGDLRDHAMERRLRANLPANARIEHLSPAGLRDLYASARFVVMPLEDVESDAGATALTEAMAMGKAVIVTRTHGQIDVIEDGEQGIYVRPGDPRALRQAIEYLVTHPEEADRMGRAGRALVEKRHTLTEYVECLEAIVRGEAVPDRSF
jgi:glycosyltransferase involved in cell wall biosynthesis